MGHEGTFLDIYHRKKFKLALLHKKKQKKKIDLLSIFAVATSVLKVI